MKKAQSKSTETRGGQSELKVRLVTEMAGRAQKARAAVAATMAAPM